MSGLACVGCAAALSDVYLCAGCAEVLAAQLYRAGSLAEDLDITFARLDQLGGAETGVRAASAERPLAFHWAAAEAAWCLAETLARWATALAAEHDTTVPVTGPRPINPKDPAAVLPARTAVGAHGVFLAEHVGWIATHADAAEILAEIDYAMAEATRAIDRRPTLAYAGPCATPDPDDGRECDADLYGPPRAVIVTCRACGAQHDMAERRAWLLAAAQDQLLTAAEASRALPGMLGRPITASMIRGLAHRGRLAQRPGDPWLPAHVRRPRYRVGDIVDAVLAETNR